MTVFIGDVHGKYDCYKKILKGCRSSIQVGDMGVGFRHLDGKPFGNPPFDKMVKGNHRFIRGNHDNPGACHGHSQWIPDGSVESETMFVGGAVSIDQARRVEGYSWWADEELSAAELQDIVDSYIEKSPYVMVTHDCPESVADYMVAAVGGPKLNFPSRSRQAFESMFHHHQPDLWIFGHWHESFDMKIEGTRFVCLAELEARDFDVPLGS